jgi:hypothetical protein
MSYYRVQKEVLKVNQERIQFIEQSLWSGDTNRANSLIGDEQEERDFDLKPAGIGYYLMCFPDWFINDRPRPSSGRKTFSTWVYHTRDSKLQKAGLIGPVKLKPETRGIKY